MNDTNPTDANPIGTSAAESRSTPNATASDAPASDAPASDAPASNATASGAPALRRESVTELQIGDKHIWIVGTAHVSKQSVEEVRQVIAEVQPDTVCVELDAGRKQALIDEQQWEKIDIFQIIKEGKTLLLLSNLLLSSYQRRVGEKLGVKPGAEMLAAIEAAKQHGAALTLADRDIQITLKRTWRSMSLWDQIRVLGGLSGSAFASPEELTEEKIEDLKKKDQLAEAMQEFATQLPAAKRPLIDERDQYLISMTREAPGTKIVTVVGAGHVPGMIANAELPVDRDKLNVVPPPSLLGRVLPWLIPIAVLGAFYFGYSKHSGEGLTQMLYAWVLPNSIFATLFAILGRAKFLTVVTSFVASPITSLNPTIGAGIVAGLVEAWLRKPTVGDCKRVKEDSKTLRGMYKNPFTRVLVVAVLVTIGSAIGSWTGATWVVSLL